MKFIIVATSIWMMLGLQVTWAMPRVTGNGGGGILSNGIYMTFYSAGVYVNSTPESDVPGTQKIENTLIEMGLTSPQMQEFLKFVMPEFRRYFKVNESTLDETTYKRIQDEYARITKQPSDKIQLFAITDIGKSTTYLFPEYYKLTEIEQAAILFHEAYWLMKPHSSYEDVVSFEAYAQKYMTYKENGLLDLGFLRIMNSIVSDEALSLRAALKYDLDKRNISKNLVSSNGVYIGRLMVKEDCEFYGAVDWKSSLIRSGWHGGYYLNCELSNKSFTIIRKAAQEAPKSTFLKELLYKVSNRQKIYMKNVLGMDPSQYRNLDSNQSSSIGAENPWQSTGFSDFTKKYVLNVNNIIVRVYEH